MPTASAVKTYESSTRAQNVISIFRVEARSLVSLAVPLIAGMLSSVFVALTDTYFLRPLGEVPLAAVSLTTSVAIILYAALYGLMGPVGYLIGTAYGAPAIRPKSRRSSSTASCLASARVWPGFCS